MELNIKDLRKVFKQTFQKWCEKDPFRESAIIAYYSIFSLPGLLLLIITIAVFFFGKSNPASGYGAAVSIVLILLCVSYSSMILFFGAEFTATYSKMFSGKIISNENGVKVVANKQDNTV
jgi:membrane protein